MKLIKKQSIRRGSILLHAKIKYWRSYIHSVRRISTLKFYEMSQLESFWERVIKVDGSNFDRIKITASKMYAFLPTNVKL